MQLKKLIANGFLPKELPPMFSADSFAAVADDIHGRLPTKRIDWTEPVVANLARPGTLRRKLSIPNPITHLHLAGICANNWAELDQHMSMSSFSLSRPTENSSHSNRALAMAKPFSSWSRERLSRMPYGRFVVRADISDFYGSIYTHSIDWALHTKASAKSLINVKGAQKTLGASLDHAVRSAQDGQTKGIPVGPDTSLVLAEIILSRVDAELMRKFPGSHGRVIRFMDDLDFYAKSQTEAEDFLTELDRKLGEYDLTLNSRKTSILPFAPAPTAPWVVKLYAYDLSGHGPSLANKLERFFSLAFELARENPSDAILSFAVSKAVRVAHDVESWTVLQNAMLACTILEPSSLSGVVAALVENPGGFKLDRTAIEQTLNSICEYQAPLEHGSEVAWSLYGLGALGYSLEASAAAKVVTMQDNCSLILLMSHINIWKSLVGVAPDITPIITRADSSTAPISDSWLLSYEAARNKWSTGSFFQQDPLWKRLLDSKVSFFDPHSIRAIAPVTTVKGSSLTYKGARGSGIPSVDY